VCLHSLGIGCGGYVVGYGEAEERCGEERHFVVVVPATSIFDWLSESEAREDIKD
jgi:hypothetical protein